MLTRRRFACGIKHYTGASLKDGECFFCCCFLTLEPLWLSLLSCGHELIIPVPVKSWPRINKLWPHIVFYWKVTSPAGLCSIMFGIITESFQPLGIYMFWHADVDGAQDFPLYAGTSLVSFLKKATALRLRRAHTVRRKCGGRKFLIGCAVWGRDVNLTDWANEV